jgi:hypothetical protein
MPDPRVTPRPTDHDSPAPSATEPLAAGAGATATTPATPPHGLSLTQIAGGALAAVTAAVAASFFGVGGTLVGAAFGSVVSSVAAALYSTSLTRAARAGAAGVSKVLVVRPEGSGTGPLEASAQDPAAVPPVVPREPADAASAATGPWWTRVRWRPVALVAGLLFVVAMAVVSVSELALGHPLGNSGASGTTLTNLGGASAPAPSPSGGTPGASPTATPSLSGTVSPTPSASGSPVVPSPTASPAPSGTGGSTPSPTAGSGTGSTTGTPAPTAPTPTP